MGKRVIWMALLALGAGSGACGGSGSITGKIDGNSLSVGETLFAVGPSLYDASVQALWVYMSSNRNRCADIAAKTDRKNMSELQMTVFKVPPANGTPTPPSAGTYNADSIEDISTLQPPPVSTSVSWGLFAMTDATCQQVYSGAAGSKVGVTGGTVTLKSFSAMTGGTASGSFTFTVGTQGDKVSGDFDAAYCPALSAALAAPTTDATGPGLNTCAN